MQIFIETINHFGAWLVENLRQLSIELLILAGIVLAVLFLLRVRSPRVRHAFWLLVLAKPVATLLIASPISLYWFLQPAAPAPSPPPRIVAVSPAPAQMPTPQRDYVPGHFPRRTGAISAPVEVQTPSAWSFVDVYGVAAVVWVVVASALGLRLLVGFIYVSFLRKTAEVQGRDTPLGEAMIEAARRLHMHPRARVALSGVSHAPVLAGIVRPMILLPRALPKQLPAEQVRLVIAHELTHVRRWDNLVLLLQRIAEMLLFFHPVVWLCGWVMRREAENACDDAVLRAYGLSAEYAESLTRVAETHHNLARRLLVNTFAAAESNLARRVRRILTGRGGRRTLILSIFAVVALILLGCLGLPTTAERKADSQEQPSSPAKEKQPVNINYSKLELKGNHETQDAFSLVVQAAARLYGRDVDYETLYALSTNAFAPDIRLDEPTKCHWQVQGRGRCLDLVARRIGLNVHMLPQPDRGKTPPAPDDPAQREAWLRTYYRLPFVEPVRQALAAGEVIITDRVWDYRDAFWCDWGIILEARDNGTLIGATTNGKKDNRMSHIGPSVPVLSNGESTISAHDADVEMLRLAFYRIHGSERFAPGPESGKGVVFGLAAMDAWIHQMNSVPYDTEQWEGNDRSADQAKKTALPTYEGAKVAAAYLRKRADTFAEGARPHLEAAAKHYDRIVKLLSPAITGKGGENYDRFMGNPAKQKAHIEHVLKPVKAELAAAADEMEQALAAEGVKVERTSNPGQPITVAASETETPAGEITQKRIDMPAPSDASGNTYARGMSAVLSHLGTNISYDRIMGLTGVAFILQLDTGGPFIDGELDSGWWPNDAWGFDLGLPVLSRATGWELRKIRCGEAYKTDPAAEYRRALAPTIETSLAAGKPVLAEYDHCFIVTAADNEEPPLLGYGTRGKSTQFKDVLRIADYPCGLIVFGEKTTPLNSKETDLLSLQHIVALFNEQAQGAGAPKTRFSGRGAWKEWLALMRKGVGCDNNMLIHLRYNRGSAVAYLREMAGHHTGKTKEHINAAADLYQQALDELNKQGLPYNRVQNGESEQVVLAEYTAMVERVFKLETQAVNKLEQALMAEGVKVSKSPSNSSVSSNGAETMSNPANTTSNEPLAKNVRREGGKVWIEGVQGFHPGEYANSVAGSGTRILQMLGESLSYDDLICYSAFAFRVEFHDKNCPSAGHPYCGYACVDNGIRAIPWNIKVFGIHVNGKPRENQAEFETETRAAIKASIDRGIPVHYGCEEDGLIIGYGDDGKRWWCIHPYHKQGKEAFWYDEGTCFTGGKDKWPWGIAVWTEPKSKEDLASKRDLTIAALKQAVDMWKTENRGDYFVGDAAYGFWLQWLRDVEAGKVQDPKVGMQGNGWCFDVLIHSRRIAGTWLNQTADDFTGETAKQLHIAADHYSQIAKESMKNIKSSWDLAPSPKQFDAWTSQMRQEQIARLESAREHDRAAIEAITRALAAEEEKASKSPVISSTKSKQP